jgi:hypothetical protein
MHKAITGYLRDDAGQWVAKLDCGHNQHVEHNPPAQNNAWVLTQTGRDDKVGVLTICKKCIEGTPRIEPGFDGRYPTGLLPAGKV